MVVLLIITALGTILLGHLVMRRLDLFIDRGGITDSPQGRINRGMLVYGAPDAAEKMQKAGIKCALLTTSDFPEDGFFSALLALSADDLGNLAVCGAAKRADPGIYIIARCNSPELRGVFEAAGAKRLLCAGEPIEGLLAEMRGDGR
jgi:hypothetical protein